MSDLKSSFSLAAALLCCAASSCCVIAWIAGIGGVAAGRAEFVSAPVCWIDLPPDRILPEKASCIARWSDSNFDVFTDEIENSTMNSAMSSVIMSEYVSSQRSSFSCSPA